MTGHSSSLAHEHCSSWSIAITSASYLTKSPIGTIPKYNRVAVLKHIDNLLCRSWWQPVVSVVETNAALPIPNRYCDFFNKFRDSRWRSDHQFFPCRTCVVGNVVDEQIRHCAIAGTKKNEYLDACLYEQHWSFGLAFLVFGWRLFRVTNA